jgi:hypothetical protein
MKKLFPRKVVTKAKKAAEEAVGKDTKGESKE